MNTIIQYLYSDISVKLTELESLRPIDSASMKRIYDKYRLELNYHTNNIEGNTLTIGETKSLILLGMESSIAKKVRDVEEMRGHIKAFEDLGFLSERVLTDNKLPLELTQNFIKNLHQKIFVEDEVMHKQVEGQSQITTLPAGNYKIHSNSVLTNSGEIFEYAQPDQVPSLMSDLLDWYNNARLNFNPIALAAMFHYKFIRIHPFGDGNGRMARLLMNLILQSSGYALVIVKSDPTNRNIYLNSLRLTDNNFIDIVEVIGSTVESKFEPFIQQIAELELDSLNLMIRGAKSEDISELEDIIRQAEQREQNRVGNQFYSLQDINSDPDLLKQQQTQFQKIVDTIEGYAKRVIFKSSFKSQIVFVEESNNSVSSFNFSNLVENKKFVIYIGLFELKENTNEYKSIEFVFNLFLINASFEATFNTQNLIGTIGSINLLPDQPKISIFYLDPSFETKLKNFIIQVDQLFQSLLDKPKE